MKPAVLVLVVSALIPSVGGAQSRDTEHPSTVSRILATYDPPAIERHSPEAMAEAAERFLGALNPGLRRRATFPLDSKERQRWTNVPPGKVEGGVRLGDCSPSQIQRACDLLATVMSRQGYEKARSILLADDRLLPGGKPRRGFGAENFWVVIFGKPSTTKEWALQLDGHHVAINVTVVGDRVTMSPSFIGTQPSAFKIADEEIVPLRDAVRDAQVLVNALTPEQRKLAVVSPTRGRIRAGAGRDGVIPTRVGLCCKELTDEQRRLLVSLIRRYVDDMPQPHAERRMKKLATEIDAMHFSWQGPTTEGSDVSYHLYGPSVIIEYACQDLGGDPLQHLHSMYRDPTNEYGAAFR